MRTERTQNSHWSKVPHELISCKYLTRTIYRGSLTASVLIICPLSGLIQDQIVEAESLGLSAKYSGEMLDGESEAFDDQLL